MINIKFKITRFINSIAFQILEINDNFWNKIATVIPTLTYTASNDIIITINNTASDISLLSQNKLIISNKSNLTTVSFADNTLRDTAYRKCLSAIYEFVTYINNNGQISKVCKYCFNYSASKDKFCNWIIKTNDNWDINTDYCSCFSLFYDYGPIRDIHTL